MSGKKLKKLNLKGIKKTWEIAVIILLNIMIIAAAISVSPTFSSVEGEVIPVLSKLGSRGDEVRRIQTKLRELGLYRGSVDGIYGSVTRDSVRQFQRNVGITVDGIAGPKTLLFLGLGGSSGGSSRYSNSDVDLLARVISAEARGESYIGQVAVGAVVLNRVKHASFPDSIAGVVYQPGAFTCVRDSNWNKATSDSARKAAQDCINGWDPSGGAIYYYNPGKTSSQWMRSRPVTTAIGSHVFCR